MQNQTQPPQAVPACDDAARKEFQKFLLAVDTYAASVAKEPGLTFEQHLRSIFAGNR